jgi:Ca-activated chloride channel family protein
LLPWLVLVGGVLVIVGLARPQHGREEFRVRTEGIAIEMCLDRSGSMQAMDFELDGERANRLAAVKDVFERFVTGKDDLPGRRNDQIGLIAFGGYAHDKCPLTLDHGVLSQITETIKIPEPIYDEQGRMINERLLQEEHATAIGDAVAAAVDRLKDAKAKSKIIILLSDGEQTAGAVQPLEAAEAAKAYGIKIYSIGIGSTGVAPFPAIDGRGRKVLIRQQVRLDEETLKMMAEVTGGQYFNAKNTETLKRVYAEIDKLEKSHTEGRRYTQYRELYEYLLLPGLALMLLQIVLVSTRFRSLP